MRNWNWKSFVVGVAVAGVIMISATAETVFKSIEVSYGTVKKIVINNKDMTQGIDKQPFVYNDTTYVPLRYISESLYKKVEWDGNTGTITIGGFIVPDNDANDIYKAIEENVKHMNTENIEGYMGDMSNAMDEAMLNITKSTMHAIFGTYDLNGVITDKKIISFEGDKCEVEVVMETRKVSGTEPYNNNVTTSIHKMIKEDGNWKFLTTTISKIDELN